MHCWEYDVHKRPSGISATAEFLVYNFCQYASSRLFGKWTASSLGSRTIHCSATGRPAEKLLCKWEKVKGYTLDIAPPSEAASL